MVKSWQAGTDPGGYPGIGRGMRAKAMADLPARVQEKATFRDILRKDSLRQQQEKFRIRESGNQRCCRDAGM